MYKVARKLVFAQRLATHFPSENTKKAIELSWYLLCTSERRAADGDECMHCVWEIDYLGVSKKSK